MKIYKTQDKPTIFYIMLKLGDLELTYWSLKKKELITQIAGITENFIEVEDRYHPTSEAILFAANIWGKILRDRLKKNE